eukprot:TRINITY_DN2254_c0_g1_i10.p2 TRINITY_DN2254_c0_g1~~TRINITY_DN2254_c0_g1_i10.p2  ORF type:complete len:503 (-),score=78.82 TRINITY_DN2254_c0_g1_i10:1927-3435(-)
MMTATPVHANQSLPGVDFSMGVEAHYNNQLQISENEESQQKYSDVQQVSIQFGSIGLYPEEQPAPQEQEPALENNSNPSQVTRQDSAPEPVTSVAPPQVTGSPTQVPPVPSTPMSQVPHHPNPVLVQQPPMYAYGYPPASAFQQVAPPMMPTSSGMLPRQASYPPPVTMPQGHPMDPQLVRYNSEGHENGVVMPPMAMYPPPGAMMMPQPSMQSQASMGLDPSSRSSAETSSRPDVEFVGSRHGGIVKWFSASKGYGFIMPDEGDDDVFIHQSDILSQGYRSLKQGTRVEYCIEPIAEGKMKAVQVTGPGGAEPEGGSAANRGSQNFAYYNNMQQMYGYPYPPAPGRAGYQQGGVPADYSNVYPNPYYYYPYYVPAQNSVKSDTQPGQVKGSYPSGEHPVPYHSLEPNARASPNGHFEETGPSGYQIVVHNLAWSCSWQELKDAFGAWKPVRADVILDSIGRSRGFGVVKFGTKEAAQAAIEGMSNQLIAGRPVTVRLDKFA